MLREGVSRECTASLALEPFTLAAMTSIGYLLPTRERVMAGTPGTGPLLALAERAESLGYDSLWAGDSLLARPRHDPLTLLAAVAARTSRPQVGTAVLLPVLRNPVVLAQQLATLDQVSEGRPCSAWALPPTTLLSAQSSPLPECPSTSALAGRWRRFGCGRRCGRASR